MHGMRSVEEALTRLLEAAGAAICTEETAERACWQPAD